MTEPNPRRVSAATSGTTMKAPKRGLQSFLGVSTFLALVLATGAATANADFVFRYRSAAIEASAPALPDGAIKSGPDVLLPPPVTANGSRPAIAGATYRATRPMAEIGAELIAERPVNILSVDRYNYYVCYSPTRSLPKCLRDVLLNADFDATAFERDGYLYYRSPKGFTFTPRDEVQRSFLARFDFRQVSP